MIKEGDKLLICVEVTVVKKETGHGTCYKVELPKKDFIDRRFVWVNEDEIEKVTTDF